MKWAAWAIIVYGVLLGSIGVVAALASESGSPALAAMVFTPLFTWLGARMLVDQPAYGFAAGALIMLLGLFNGYRFIATGNWAYGTVLVASFLVLFAIIAGLFSSLE